MDMGCAGCGVCLGKGVFFEGGCENEEMTDLRLKMSWRKMDAKLNELHVDGRDDDGWMQGAEEEWR